MPLINLDCIFMFNPPLYMERWSFPTARDFGRGH